ncbi:uncharacterized protein LOC117342198 [Pecten maximus]|uniref:uncharacterized protein LOC117342198 n=1 Tax=Pecten maximus TaxID=6579 RepID=UPI0014581497|nr:uncharacterized protein LOC117342198 [Pecten maximus]
MGCRPMWGGDYCASENIFHSKVANHVMQFLSIQTLINRVTSPIERQLDGRFKALYTGLYMLYINTQSLVKDSHHEIGLFISDDSQKWPVIDMSCIVATDRILTKITSRQAKYIGARTKSCGNVGTFYIEKDQMISIVITRPQRAVMLSKHTNFGAVLLSHA